MRSLVFCVITALLQVIQVIGQSNVPIITDYSALDSRYLDENLPLDYVVGTITAFDPDGTDVTFDLTGRGSEYFSIGRTSGIVTLKKVLDFDTPSEREILMYIEVTDGNLQTTDTEGKVFVNDVNDLPPYFLQTAIFKDLPEDTPVGFAISDITVKDRDTISTGFTVVCKPDSKLFADACDKFELITNVTQNSNQDWYGKLVLKKSLDFELRESFAILLEARDGVFNVTEEVHIEVQDINDSPPIWDRIVPISIDEENPIGDTITAVTASDGDATNPHRINYEIIGDSVFQINSATGEISNKVRLDFDTTENTRGLSYEVSVKAREVTNESPFTLGNDSSSTSVAVVTIMVIDIDDNPPTFNQAEYSVQIMENIVTGSNIPGLQMTVTDADSTFRFYNSFDLVLLDHTDVFDIVPERGTANAGATLFVKDDTKIDYEEGIREYVMRVEAREPSPLTLTGTAVVKVTVGDVNDETPGLDSDTYSVTISETSPPGFVVKDLDAFDREAGNFGTAGIRYQLFGSLSDQFVIDRQTGVITVGNCSTPGRYPCIDAERKNQTFLSVSATDELGSGRTISVQVVVTITDENDNRPLPDNEYTAYINEGQTVPIQPLIIKAFDPDRVGGPVTYQLHQANGLNDVISNWQITITTDSQGDRIGTITARRPILLSDAVNPAEGKIYFQVISSDQKDTVPSNVTIIIIDINNNSPEFSPSTYETDINEGDQFSVSLFKVSATDGDAPTTGNGIIDFTIISGGFGKFAVREKSTDNNVFNVEIYTTPDASFNYDLQKKYEIILEARDQGTPESMRGTATLIVNILDINNNNPEITPSSISIDVPEDQGVGSLVHTIEVIDTDKTSDIVISITATEAQNPTGSLTDGNIYKDLFRVDNSTGQVRVNKPLNRELTSFVVYQIKATDIGATPPQEGFGALFITITEVNDQDPVFEEDVYNITIDEELNLQHAVRNLHCTDVDDQIASYSLTPTNPTSPAYFDVVLESGLMTVTNRIDFEAIETIEMVATCFDDGTPQRSATAKVVVNLRNINDNSPDFKESLYRGQIDETKVGENIGGTFIQTVDATDLDKGDFGVVYYGMVDPSNPFQIDSTSGVITVKSGGTFDRESQGGSIGFQVVAYDSPNNSAVRRSTTVPVYVTINDINDNCPTFSEAVYKKSIPESIQINTDIVDIIATDLDIGVNRLISFSFDPDSLNPADGQDYFDIGIKSGRISAKLSLNGHPGVYRFNVTATDTEGRNADKCSSHVPVEVTVTASSNNAPSWTDPPSENYVIYVLESQYEGMLVYHANAVDADPGSAGLIDYYFRVGDESVSVTPEFRINQFTGIIRAEIEYDREEVDKYFLTLVAQDRGVTRATSLITLVITIIDVDDNEPVFPVNSDGTVIPLVLPSEPYPAVVDGDSTNLPRIIGQCNANDADSDHANNEIFYELLTGDAEFREKITVDIKTCEIELREALDFETTPRLEFSIYAYNLRTDDSVQRSRRAVNPSILPAVLEVTDMNDNAPQFTEDEYFACTALATPYDSTIVDVDAHDLEQMDTELVYSLKNMEHQFTIDAQGVVRNNFSFTSVADRVFKFAANVSDGINTADSDVHIFVTSEATQIKLKVDRPTSDVKRVITEYQNLVHPGSDDYYTCVDVKNHFSDTGVVSTSESDVYLSVVEKKNGQYVHWTSAELDSYLAEQKSQDDEKYRALSISEIEKVDNDLSLDEDVVLIILIITIILIILAILLLCLACCCIWRTKTKKKRKVKARRHTFVNASDSHGESYANPVYHNAGYSYEDEYSTINKARKETERSPVQPVVIPIGDPNMAIFQPQSESEPNPPEVPEYQPEPEAEPVIETELEPEAGPEDQPDVPDDLQEPEPVIETEVASLRESEPPEPVIETEVASIRESEPAESEPDMETETPEIPPDGPEPVIETEVLPEELPPHPDVDDRIETEVSDADEPPLPAAPTSSDITNELPY